MSALPARAATAGTLALALALALPAAAFADPSEDERGRSQAAQEQERQDERGRSETAPHGQGGDAGKADDNGSDQSADKADDQGKAEGKGKAGSTGKRGQGASGDRAKTGDPRGNNGTVKIDGEAFDDGRGNEPHVGCVFQVDFYGFDAGDTASITFTGHAPTGGGLLHSESGTRISDDAAGGGQDRDATLTFSVQNQLSELLAVTPHPQQGWHVKLAVDVDSAPGGAKQKVFWIDCPQTPALGGGTTSPATGGGTTTTTPTTTTPTLGAGTTTVLPATVVSGKTVAAVERVEAQTFGSGAVTLTGTETAAAAGSGVTSQSAARPSVLPFTGSQALLYLLGLGLSAVGVGAIAHRMGRQQADLG